MDRGGYSPGPAGRKAAASVKTPSGRNGAGASQPAQLRPNGAFFKHIFFNALMARVTPSSGEGSNGKGTKASYDALWKIAKEEGEGLQSQRELLGRRRRRYSEIRDLLDPSVSLPCVLLNSRSFFFSFLILQSRNVAPPQKRWP